MKRRAPDQVGFGQIFLHPRDKKSKTTPCTVDRNSEIKGLKRNEIGVESSSCLSWLLAHEIPEKQKIA
jgi:hypothetical protein